MDYDTLQSYGMEERSHKQYLNNYFQGYEGESNSRGELYNADPVTDDARFCGTTASMCGIETAAALEDGEAVKKAVRLDVMLHAYMFMQSGIPVLYSGDEVGQLNDYTYKDDPDKAADSRYIHRGAMDWKLVGQTDKAGSVAGQIFSELSRLETIRKSEKVFVTQADAQTMDTGDAAILCMTRCYEGEKLVGLFNFSECDKTVQVDGLSGKYRDMLSGKSEEVSQITVPAYGFYYLKSM